MARTGRRAKDEEAGPHSRHRLSRAGLALRGLAVDLTPLRESRDFRLLWLGELVSTTGRQISVVALPYQVYRLTGSSLAVGMIGLVQVVPLVLFSLLGGAIADRVDRRALILGTEAGLAVTSGLLVVGAVAGNPPLAYLYGVTAVQSAVLAINSPTRAAAIPSLVPRTRLPAALALNQVMFNTTLVVGPAVGGLVLARLGLAWAYSIDVVTFAASIVAAVLLHPLSPSGNGQAEQLKGLRAIREGFRFLRGRRVLVSTFLIDLDAMIFGMPRALFPVLALSVFRVGPQGLGLLYAAPAVGALAGALTAGWVGRVRRRGMAVIWAVVVWGLAITGFGFAGRRFWLALVLLGVAGAADVVSAVFRSTILQLSVPESLRGRLSAVHIMVVTGGPRLGDVEAGVVASLTSPMISVVSGGLACVLGVLVLAVLVPELARHLPDHSPRDLGASG